MPRGLGKIQQKALLLLFGGLVLGLSRSPRRHFRIIKSIGREWGEIEKRALQRAIKSLYESKLINTKIEKDGSITIILNQEGKKKALTFQLDKIKIKRPQKWDKQWRVVLFDIPEDIKKKREVLRFCLKRLGFYEFQKSVFVHPYDCQDEIDYIIEFYNIRKFVRFIIANSADNELHLKHHFGLR